ncbi:TetR/AcrR family transcriptional regulator C-terminal domain-containing protein [Streptomyces sp. NPDC090025]|uniref:TetR/AcrR family transcriptional regulator C-terminal domain-containing protein n=1 Tax=Streptomyces sp. NPDC090025 TaxID=3365922 RepID=UPI0038327E2A
MTLRPPYLVIAAEIERRIRAGELSPGDRVPSTRAITREWGVAMATATKALAALRQEGLVRPEPGVGTVVAARAAGSAAERAADRASTGLTRERIVRAALEIADAEGLGALTMRRLGTALAVSTTALYRHVPGKGELVRLMTDAVCAEIPLGPVPSEWRTGLERSARWLRGVYARHRWMPQAMASLTRPVASAHAMAYTEWTLTALRGTPLTGEQRMYAHLSIFACVQGIALADDVEEQARQDTGMSGDEWMERNEPRYEAAQATGSYPRLFALTETEGFEVDLDALFEFALGRTLDGVARLIGETSA